jgi:hypothetical protein
MFCFVFLQCALWAYVTGTLALQVRIKKHCAFHCYRVESVLNGTSSGHHANQWHRHASFQHVMQRQSLLQSAPAGSRQLLCPAMAHARNLTANEVNTGA